MKGLGLLEQSKIGQFLSFALALKLDQNHVRNTQDTLSIRHPIEIENFKHLQNSSYDISIDAKFHSDFRNKQGFMVILSISRLVFS